MNSGQWYPNFYDPDTIAISKQDWMECQKNSKSQSAMDNCIMTSASRNYNNTVKRASGYCFQGDDTVKGLPKDSNGNVNQVCVPDNDYPNNRCTSGWKVDPNLGGGGICCAINGELPPGCKAPLPEGYKSTPVVKYLDGEKSYGYIPPGAEASSNYPGYAFPIKSPIVVKRASPKAAVKRVTKSPRPSRAKFGSMSGTNWLLVVVVLMLIAAGVFYYMKKRNSRVPSIASGISQFGKSLKRGFKFN